LLGIESEILGQAGWFCKDKQRIECSNDLNRDCEIGMELFNVSLFSKVTKTVFIWNARVTFYPHKFMRIYHILYLISEGLIFLNENNLFQLLKILHLNVISILAWYLCIWFLSLTTPSPTDVIPIARLTEIHDSLISELLWSDCHADIGEWYPNDRCAIMTLRVVVSRNLTERNYLLRIVKVD
jgi:hypothetical protein